MRKSLISAQMLLSCLVMLPAAYAQPTISKVFTPNTIGPGSTSTITITITNGSGLPVTDLAFTDVLPVVPGPMTIADPANASTTCDLGISGVLSAPDGGSTISLSDAQIGAAQSCTVNVDVTASTPGAHTNPAITLSSSAGSSMSLPIDLTVITGLPGFSKSFAPSSISLGDRSTLTFTIDNTLNASPVGNLDFTDALPAGMLIADPANAFTDCVSASAPDTTLTAVPGTGFIGLNADGSTFFPGFEVLPIGAICTVTVDVVGSGIGVLDNVTSDLLADFTSAGKASDTLTVTITPLAIVKEFTDDPVAPGGTVTLDFILQNFDRNFSATGLAFTDDLSTLVPPLAGLTFDSLLSNDCGGSVSGVGGTVIGLSGGTLAPEGTCTVSVSLSVPAGATPGSHTNTTSTVTATVDGSPVVGNMATDVLFVAPTPILTKEFLEVGTLAPNPVINAGDDVVLRFTITNPSTTSGATDIAFTDELTDGGPGTGFLPFPVSVTLPPTPDPPCGGGSTLGFFFPDIDRQGLSLTGGNLAAAPGPGDSCTFEVTLTVPADVGPGIYTNTTGEITATIDGGTRTGDPASDTLTVIAAPELNKSFLGDPVAPGNTVTLEFTLSHSANSPTDATDITFTDDLSFLAGLTANLPSTPDPPCGAGSSLVGSAGDTLLTLMDGVLMPGETCTFSVTLNVPAGASGSFVNTTSGISATVSGTPVTALPASDTLVVGGMIFSKEFIGSPAFPGEVLTLRFSLENISAVAATGIGFTDSLFPVAGLVATDPALVNDCGGTLTVLTVPMLGSFLTYAGGTLAAGMTCTVDVEVTVPLTASDGIYPNNVTDLAFMLGATPGSGAASDDLIVESDQLSLFKSFTDDPVAPGDTVTLEFTLVNLDGGAASAVAFTDDLGATLAGLTFDSVLFNDCGGTVLGTGTTMIDVSGASVAGGGSCTLRVSLTVPGAATAGFYPNTTSGVTGTIGGAPVTGDPATDILEIIDLLLFSKSFDGPTTATGMATLTFTITNPGTSAASGISFSDDLNAVIPGLIAISLPAVPCGAGSSITGISFLTFTGGNLPPLGGMCSFDVDVLVPAGVTAGTYPNVTSDLNMAGLVVGDPATADLVIEPPPTFTKVFMPDAILSGMVSTLRFVINNGASALAANNLDFTDNLPAGVVVATPSVTTNTCGGTLSAVAGSGVISLTGGTVAAGGSCTIDVDVTSITPGMHVNLTGDLTSSSGNSGTATDTLTVTAAADVSVTKTDGVTSAAPGTSVVYTIVAANAGPNADPSVTLADTFPSPPLTCTYTSVAAGGATGNTAAGAGDLAETLSMPAGSSVTYTATCAIDADATGTLSNTATVTTSITDPVLGNNSATDADTVLDPEADLEITKTDGVTSAVPGLTTLTYTIVASNNGPSDDPSVTVTDTFPVDLTCTYTSVAAGGATGNTAAGAGDLAETLSMPAGSSVTYTAICTIDPAATGTLSNTATISGSVTDSVPGNNSATDSDTVLVAESDLSITKTDGVTQAVPGQTTLTYTIVASNSGPSDDPSVTVTDTFPAVLTCTYTSVAAGGATGNTAAGAGDLAETLSMPGGSSVTYTVSCTIDPAATGTLSNTATITASVTDSVPGNNSATDNDTVLMPEASVSITKTDGVTSADPGDTLVYTIVVSNAGPSSATGTAVADTFPAGLTGVTWTCVASASSTCGAGGAGDIADTADLAPGGTATYTATGTVDAGFTGTLTNTATATPTGVDDPDMSDNSATDTTTVTSPSDVFGTKEVAGDFVPGGLITYTIHLINGSATAQQDDPMNPEFTDDLPPELTLVSASADSGTVSTLGNTVFWDGMIPGNGMVEITIEAQILASAADQEISNQGEIFFDSDGDGTNDTMIPTDDPDLPGGDDQTAFVVAGAIAIPTADTLGLMFLASLLIGAALCSLRRRQSGAGTMS